MTQVVSTNEAMVQRQRSGWLPPGERPEKNSSFSLSLRISLWLIAVAILPLVIALAMNYLQTRPTLVNQASTTLQADTRTHTQLIDNYLAGKLLTLKSLDYTPLVQQYLANPQGDDPRNVQTILQNGEAIQKLVNPDVLLVAFFTPQGKLLLSYSVYGNTVKPHGQYLIPPEDLQKAALGQQFISGVYYDPNSHLSTVELYTPVYSTELKRVLGIVRDTLNLQTIWNIVQSEIGANGNGSSAFILDQYGVRIIDPDTAALFTSIAPIDEQIQQQIQGENLYGKTGNVQLLADEALRGWQNQHNPPPTLQEVPVNANEMFEVARQPLTSVSWTYFVLTPINVVEAVANQQLLTFAVITLAVLLLAAVIGWVIGNRISTPISRALETLVNSSTALSQLAEREKHAASEQVWVVGSVQVGLHSVQYYTQALKIAAQRLNDVGEAPLRQNQVDVDMVSLLHTLETMVRIGQYFEKAVGYQEESNQKVAIALKVADEVTAQLAAGATSTKEAANELGQVVTRLRRIVGS